MPLPKPTPSVEILAKAKAIKETIHEGDANTMLGQGFILVAVRPTKGEDAESHPYTYSLIYPFELTDAIKELWHL
jgi:hypothetical protein